MLWRSAPPTSLMRVNAPIPALLALAVVCLFPVCSLAKPVRHRAAKTATVSAHRKPAVRTVHGNGRHHAAASARVKAQVPSPRRRHPVIRSGALARVVERPHLRSVEEEASTPVILPSLYNKRGR